MAIEGVDYAFPPHPSPASLVAAGKQFVVRYGGPGTEDKWVHADEAQALAAAGLWIVANAEGSAAGLANGFNAGVSWAQSADTWFRGIGMPRDRPIYFSVDFDTDSGDWSQLEAAMDGAAAVIGRDRVGVYGEYSIVAHLHGTGRAAWSWQTYAWSTGRWYVGNHLEQYKNGVSIGGADCDLNRAMQADYGQWMPGGDYGPIGGDMTPVEHNWLYNTAQIIYYLSQGADGCDVVNSETGAHYTLSFQEFWDKVGGAELGAEAIAAVAKAAAEGANTGATVAVEGLRLDVKLEGTAGTAS